METAAYPDSSFVVSLVCRDTKSAEANGYMARAAEVLSAKHAASAGQRTIDLLHVAIALEAGAKTFLSFDQRQRKLAKAAGLKVKP